MTHPLIDAHLDGTVLTLNLRQQARGGVQIEFIESLTQTFTDLSTMSEVRVVIVRGDLDLSLDLDHWQALNESQRVRTHQALQHMHRWRTLQLKTLPQPLLAVVSGPCGGAALPLIEGCDFALCSETSVFSLPSAQARWLGRDSEAAFGESRHTHQGSMWHAIAGQTLGARQAQDQGWVTFSLREDELASKVSELTQSLLDKDPLALQFAKETLAHVSHMGWDASVNYTAAKFVEIKARQAEAGGSSSRAHAIAGFLAGQSKPGLKG